MRAAVEDAQRYFNKVGADLAIRDHLTVELTTTALAAIKKMVKALQRSPLTPSYFVCVILRMRSTRAPPPRRAAMTATPPRGTVMTAARVTPLLPRHQPPAPPEKTKGIWWLQRGGCYQAKRKIAYEDGEPCYEWKRFKPESESIEHLCAAHEDARQWAAGGI